LIRYSRHARNRLLHRSISEDDVEKTLRDPWDNVMVRFGRRAACSRLPRGRYLVVVCEEDGEDFIVVTALKTSRTGARRYGFTRV
jgi:hypothetical protein